MFRTKITKTILWLGLGGVIFLLFKLGRYLYRLSQERLFPDSDPALDYGTAVAKVERLQALETDEIHPLCRTRLMSHGQKTERTILFLHGLTSCPQQFHALGEVFYRLGYNVLIARVPYHGYTDRMTTRLTSLKAETLISYADRVTDIAQGLGEHITLMGISMGGVLTAWIAQQRADIDQAVIISPVFAFRVVPPRLTKWVVGLALSLPNFFMWWDYRLKDKKKPIYIYPRFPIHALGEIFRISHHIRRAATRFQPQAGRILVLINDSDLAVHNQVIAEMVEIWRQTGYQNLQTYEFEKNLKLPHDFIDASIMGKRREKIFETIIELVHQD